MAVIPAQAGVATFFGGGLAAAGVGFGRPGLASGRARRPRGTGDWILLPKGSNPRKPKKPIEALILEIRNHKVLIDADLAVIYGVETRALNQAVKRNASRFPEDFIFQLNAEEKLKVITNCDHLAGLKFAKSLPHAFTEHGAIMAATVLNSPEAVTMSVFVVRAFMQMREHLAANSAILKRLAEIDKTLLQHDAALSTIWKKLQPLLAPPPEPTPRRIQGFNPNPE
jgi:hypothetical protein